MNLKKLIALVLLIVCVATTFAMAGPGDPDQGFVPNVIKQLNKYSIDHPLEKAYLQFDKPYYAAGDSIWFKAYVTVGSKHWLSGISKYLNVELIDDHNNIEQSIKLALMHGLAKGDFTLPDTLPEGNYRIRAYTNWMRNESEEYFFDKPLIIINSGINKVFTSSTSSYLNSGDSQQVTTTVNYADVSGNPYINKPVNYNVEFSPGYIVNGSGVTDNKGNLSIIFNYPKSVRSGRINTSIIIQDKDTINKTILIKATSAKVDVQFMPEGGYLVNGIESTIAFKAVGADGLGANITGTVVDEQDHEVNKLVAQHLGMGKFTIVPVAGRTYKAKITFADGSGKIIELPKAVDKGYIMEADDTDPANVKLTITTSGAMLAEHPNDTLYVVGQADGQLYYAGKSKPGNTEFRAIIPKSRFPSGIVQFTLFSSSSKNEPLNERLVFIQNHDEIRLDVDSEKQAYSPGEKVKISMNAKTMDAKPVVASFGVSVTNESKVPVKETEESTIFSNLLLTSDLRGYVEQPNYYFINENEKTQADLDLLMLTQGYRRFEWRKILNGDMPKVNFPKETSMEITGHVTNLDGKPMPHATVDLLSANGGNFFRDTLTDQQGQFAFTNLEFSDDAKFIIQARSKKDRANLLITLDRTPSPKISQDKNFPDMQVNVNNGLSAYIKNSKNFHDEESLLGIGEPVIALKEVQIEDKIPSLKYSDNLNGPGRADQVLTGDALVGCSSLMECLSGKLAGVIIRHDTAYSTRGIPFASTGGPIRTAGSMMVFIIDGITLSNGNDINSIDPNDVGVVEVLRTPANYAIYGLRGGPGGVIIITTKKGFEDKSYLHRQAPGIITFSLRGYYRARIFYSPQYDNPKTNKQLTDLRTTIYWNPDILTDKDGNASFEFYNATKGSYRVVIEGIDNDGHMARHIHHYTVN